jgi:biotin-dependent carboxylase-like uncharacterized protein
MSAALVVIRPGAQSIVVDRGRFGLRHLGVAWCGASDFVAYRTANVLCGNDGNAASLEVAFGNAEFAFAGAGRFALTGARVPAWLDGDPIETYRSYGVHDGMRLKLGFPELGARTLLAVRGGFDVAAVLGSRTTDVAAGFGGFKGRALRRDDRLPIGAATLLETDGAAEAPEMKRSVRVMPFDRFERLDSASRRAFWESAWTAGHESNRMGYRFSGFPLRYEDAGTQPHAVFPGFIQVPPSGEAIVLLSDAQVTGGYPTIGMVHEDDLPVVAQLRAGERVRFEMQP